MKKEDIPFLEQLMESIEEASIKLEKCNNEKNFEEFRKTKIFMAEMQKKIQEIILK